MQPKRPFGAIVQQVLEVPADEAATFQIVQVSPKATEQIVCVIATDNQDHNWGVKMFQWGFNEITATGNVAAYAPGTVTATAFRGPCLKAP